MNEIGIFLGMAQTFITLIFTTNILSKSILRKDYSKKYLFIMGIGFTLMFLVATLRIFSTNIDLDFLFWKLSTIGYGIGTISLIIATGEIYIQKYHKILHLFIIIYSILYFLSALTLPNTYIIDDEEIRWDLSNSYITLFLIGVVIMSILIFNLFKYSIENKKKNIIFLSLGGGFLILAALINLFLPNNFIIDYGILSIIGLSLLLYGLSN